MVGDLVKNNEFNKLYKMLVKDTGLTKYFLGLPYALFQFHSKKQFEQFKKECDKNGIFNLDKIIYNTMSSRLLTHLLKTNIWTWNDKMFNRFHLLSQKKDMMIYKYNDVSILQAPYYDFKIKYNN